MQHLYAFILLLFPLSIFGQLAVADSLFEAGAYRAAGEAYELALSDKTAQAGDYYNAACAWNLAGEPGFAIGMLDRAADAGWYNRNWTYVDSDLRSLVGHPGWDQVMDKIKANEKAHMAKFEQPLQQQLYQIYLRDQTLRQLYAEAQDKFGMYSDEMNTYWSLMQREDSLILIELIQILDTHGWPAQSKVGGQANAAAFLVIQHAPPEIQNQYLPLLRASVQAGESSGRHLAMLEDRIRVGKDQKQVYGTQYFFNPQTGQNEFFPIENPGEVNQRRAEIGLPPIEEYARRNNIQLKD
jgi:hypothetical protein